MAEFFLPFEQHQQRVPRRLTPEPATSSRLAVEIADGLHDLCQPLSVLQCRLEIGAMDGTAESMSGAIQDALDQCLRLNHMVREMQLRVLEMNPASKAATATRTRVEGDSR